MSFIKALDVSHYQGVINWPAVRAAGYEIAIIKVSGSDAGDYVDSRAGINYNEARNAGLQVGTYHFAGGTDPRHEAEYFVNVCSPLDENQVLVLDWETSNPNPVEWCRIFVTRVHELTGIWPLLYVNGSTWNAYDWKPVTDNCGVWVAWYDRDPNQDLPVKGKTYVMHQYTSSGSVPGIAGRVDLNAWYGTVEQFKKYGYHAPVAQPAPTPEPQPTPEPTPLPEPTPEPTPPVVDPPAPTPTPEPAPETPSKQASKGVVAAFLAGLAALVAALLNLLT